jgi:uncharacterized protein with HEPN domain
MKDDRLYLFHIRDCIARVEEYASGGREAFTASTMVQDAIVRNLQVLSESTQRLSDELKSEHPEVNWRGIAGFRNVLVHGYLGLDLGRLWEMVLRDLPALQDAVAQMLEQTGGT